MASRLTPATPRPIRERVQIDVRRLAVRLRPAGVGRAGDGE
ncbi:hypothetical protein ABZT47_32730 [Sphaerisporangium sp. NPDC005289]|uniref:Uncharacterized protein n=1 Tax=Sphaerisporangium rhizosphaerae TaxID=2269375 RepID=A0ABW2NZG3_9ACTN